MNKIKSFDYVVNDAGQSQYNKSLFGKTYKSKYPHSLVGVFFDFIIHSRSLYTCIVLRMGPVVLTYNTIKHHSKLLEKIRLDISCELYA